MEITLSPATMTDTEKNQTEYTIDEIAAVSQVPSRTIRFYQSKGALPAPIIRGRVAYYGSEHLDRLRLIAQLQDRGLSIKAIRDLVKELEKGKLTLNEWLGLERKLQAPWLQDQPRLVSTAELNQVIGKPRPGMVAELVQHKLVRKQGESFLIKSPALLQIALDLEKSGIDLELAAQGATIIRKYVGKAASDLADYFFKHAGRGFGRNPTVEDLGAAFEAVQPMGLAALQLIFGQEMQKVLRKLVESGKATNLSELGTKRR